MLAILLAALVVLVAAFPYLAANEPLRGWMLAGRAAEDPRHRQRRRGIAGLAVAHPLRAYRNPLARTASRRWSLPCWRATARCGDTCVSPRQLGNFRIERPQVNLVAGQQGSNLAEVFSVGKPAKAAAAPPDLSMGLEIVDAGFSFRSPGGRRALEHPATSTSPWPWSPAA